MPKLLKDLKASKKIEITRSEFEQSIQMHIEKIKDAVEECIDGSGHEVNEINHTLLVGGSTRIPIISKTIEKAGQTSFKKLMLMKLLQQVLLFMQD